VYLAGRAKDLIIRGGHNIDPAIIEDALLAHPQVTAASAVGQPDVHAGEVPVAYVTLTPAATVTEDDLRDWASQRVPDRTAAPKTVTVLDALPLTAVGKLYKLGLRADATLRELRAALDTVAGVHNVDATVEGSSIVAVVTVSPFADHAAIKAIVGRYAIESRLEVTP
jgi:fatty-acyl-CoA synthase